MIRCRKVRAWMFPFLEGELPEALCRDLREHLARCEACRGEQARYEQALRCLREGLMEAVGPVPPPPSLPELLARSREQSLAGRRPPVTRLALVSGLVAGGLAVVLWGLKVCFLRPPESPPQMVARKSGEPAGESAQGPGADRPSNRGPQGRKEVLSGATEPQPAKPRPTPPPAAGRPEPQPQFSRPPQKQRPQPSQTPEAPGPSAGSEKGVDLSPQPSEPQRPQPFSVPPMEEPTSAILCRAVTWTGEKLAGGVVLLYNARQEVIRRGPTDREGRFTFDRLPGGRYYVGLFAPIVRLIPVEVAEGQTIETQLEWPRGRISVQLEKAVAGAQAFCVAELPSGLPAPLYARMDQIRRDPPPRSSGNWPWTACISDERGRIDLPGVAPGSYTLLVQAPGYAEAVLPVEISDEQPTVEVTVSLEPLSPEAKGGTGEGILFPGFPRASS